MWQDIDLLISTLPDVYTLFSKGMAGLEFEGFPFALPPEHSSANRLLVGLFRHCKAEFERTSGLKLADARDKMNQYYVRYLLNMLDRIVNSGQYRIIPFQYGILEEMTALGLLPDLNRMLDKDNPYGALHVFLYYSVRFLHFAAGSEDTVLIGTKGEPIWRQLRKPLQIETDFVRFHFPVAAQMNDIGPDDAAFIPDPEDTLRGSGDLADRLPQFPSMRPILTLLEDAWANFRYVPNPEGSIVVFHDPRSPVRSMILKVYQSPRDETSLGLMAKLEHEHGSSFFSINDVVFILRDRPEYLPPDAVPEKFNTYLLWLCVQVYHDLVTAKQITVRRPQKEGGKGKKKPKPEKPQICTGWTYIPRVVYNRELPVRSKVLESREPYTPRYVRMHRRRANMSDEQRQAVQEFEAQYGIQVLRFIPEGYTVVRPYISPTISAEEWNRLPKYIKARIQLDLEEAVKQIANPTTELLERVFEDNDSEEEPTN